MRVVLLTILIWLLFAAPAQAWQEFEATAYTHTGNPCFTGVMPQPKHTIAVDPDVIPLGSWVFIKEKGRFYKAEDTGGLIKGRIIDIFMDKESWCWKWGRRKVHLIIFTPSEITTV